jgi:hypothetical protein
MPAAAPMAFWSGVEARYAKDEQARLDPLAQQHHKGR